VNAKTNYALVGLFVLFSIAMMTFFVIWLLQPSDEQQEQAYRIEFTESVSGLNVDSPVKYRGVTIGKVQTIRISPDNVEKIEVVIIAGKDTPIKVDTVARLRPQGITGLSYVDLSRGSKGSQRLVPKNRYDTPLIHSVPSFFVTVERTFGTASENISATLVQLKALLGEENRADIQRILHHTANITAKIDDTWTPKRMENIDRMVDSVSSLAVHLDENTPELNRILRSGDDFALQARTSIISLQQSFDSMADSMRVFKERNKNGDYSVKEHVGPGMKQFEMTMRDMQQSLILLNQILRRYGGNPSDMLFQHQPPLVGPGERK